MDYSFCDFAKFVKKIWVLGLFAVVVVVILLELFFRRVVFVDGEEMIGGREIIEVFVISFK